MSFLPAAQKVAGAHIRKIVEIEPLRYHSGTAAVQSSSITAVHAFNLARRMPICPASTRRRSVLGVVSLQHKRAHPQSSRDKSRSGVMQIRFLRALLSRTLATSPHASTAVQWGPGFKDRVKKERLKLSINKKLGARKTAEIRQQEKRGHIRNNRIRNSRVRRPPNIRKKAVPDGAASCTTCFFRGSS